MFCMCVCVCVCVCVRAVQNNLLHFLFVFLEPISLVLCSKMICHEGGSICIFVRANSLLYPACSSITLPVYQLSGKSAMNLINPLVLTPNARTFGKWSPEEWNGIAFHEVLWSLLFAKTRQTRRPPVTSTDGC